MTYVASSSFKVITNVYVYKKGVCTSYEALITIGQS